MEKYVPRTLIDRKKDDFLSLQWGGKSVEAYEGKFHALSLYATHLVSTKEERICLYMNGLNDNLQVLYVHMTSASKSLNEVLDYVKKI